MRRVCLAPQVFFRRTETNENRKASGEDKINAELLKNGGMILHLRLLHIINKCWIKREIPERWKVAEVISLFKKGDRRQCENYRGISLLNAIYKLYARIINKRLKIITETLIGEEQSGFRKGRSTSDNIFILQQILEKRSEYNLQTHIAFIDFQKAFDNVDREKLWIIMKEQGYPRQLIKVVKNLYEETKIVLNFRTEKSEEILTNKGVRQGCHVTDTF